MAWPGTGRQLVQPSRPWHRPRGARGSALNPHWDDVLEVGDVIAVEPALYGLELAAGLRLETDYLVTPDGLELLSRIPLGL